MNWPKSCVSQSRGLSRSCRHRLGARIPSRSRDGSASLVQRIYPAFWESISPDWGGLTYFWWLHVWESIYQTPHLFQPWRGQQAPLEMQGGCHWPSCHGALASLLYQQADRKGKTWALANMDKRRFIPRNLSARGKRRMNDRRFIAACVY